MYHMTYGIYLRKLGSQRVADIGTVPTQILKTCVEHEREGRVLIRVSWHNSPILPSGFNIVTLPVRNQTFPSVTVIVYIHCQSHTLGWRVQMTYTRLHWVHRLIKRFCSRKMVSCTLDSSSVQLATLRERWHIVLFWYIFFNV